MHCAGQFSRRETFPVLSDRDKLTAVTLPHLQQCSGCYAAATLTAHSVGNNIQADSTESEAAQNPAIVARANRALHLRIGHEQNHPTTLCIASSATLDQS